MENRELIKKARAAKSAKELLELARANSVELTEAEAESYFSQLHQSGELSDEELSAVSGGGCQAVGLAKTDVNHDIKPGDRIMISEGFSKVLCGAPGCGSQIFVVDHADQNSFDYHCEKCGKEGGLLTSMFEIKKIMF